MLIDIHKLGNFLFSSIIEAATVLHSVIVLIGHRSNGAVKDRVISPAPAGGLTFLWLVTSLANDVVIAAARNTSPEYMSSISKSLTLEQCMTQ